MYGRDEKLTQMFGPKICRDKTTWKTWTWMV